MANKNYYNTLLSQVYSPCGNYLLVGDIYGYISVYNLQKIINPDSNVVKSDRKPKNVFVVQCNIPIYSLLSTENFLLVGTVGEIAAYNWSDVKNSKNVKPVWKIDIQNGNDTFEKVDINCMIYNEASGYVYAGCGDNAIYVINIETRQILHSLKDHTNYIHSIFNLGNELISGGEDGIVNIWDLKTKKVVHQLVPSRNPKIQRNEFGSWIGAVAMNEDWLICGGGPRLSLWHYRSLSVSTIFPIDDKGIHVAQFNHDKILAGGSSKYFYQMNLNGEIISEIPTSSVTTYSAVYQDEPFKALCLAGSSPNVDICSNLNYRDQVLTLCNQYD